MKKVILTIVVPGIPIEQFPEPTDLEIELSRPDGSTHQAILSLQHEFITPPPELLQYACIFRDLAKEDVPVGTEIWHKP